MERALSSWRKKRRAFRNYGKASFVADGRVWLESDGMHTELAEPKKLKDRLAAHPFLRGMPAHHLEVLSESVEPAQFEAGESIFRAGESATGFYLIESGDVVIEATKGQQRPVAIDVVQAGEPLGWSWLFEPYVWEFDARAIEATTALFFSREHLWQHREEDLTLGHELFKRASKVMVRRLQAARRRLVVRQTGREE